MREWILYDIEIGTHVLKKGYEPMLTMVTKGSMIMPEGEYIRDCSLIIWVYQMEVNKTSIMVENKSFSWMKKLWNFEWIDWFITKFGEILIWMIANFFTSSYLWSHIVRLYMFSWTSTFPIMLQLIYTNSKTWKFIRGLHEMFTWF